MSIPSVPKVGGLDICVDRPNTAPEKPASPKTLSMQTAPGLPCAIHMRKRDLGRLAELKGKLAEPRIPARHKASSHNKLTRPNDLYALIAVHTDAAGRIDCSGITKLTLSRSTFTDEDLALLKNFPDLRELDLSDCTRITGKGIALLSRELEVLNLTCCNALADEDMAALPPRLKKLNLTDCVNLTGAAVAKLPREIREADFTGCIALGHVMNDAFPPFLEKVNFSECVNLSDADVNKLPHTVMVGKFSHCRRVSTSTIQRLRQRGVRIIQQKSPLKFEPVTGASHRR